MKIDRKRVREAVETPNSMITFYGIEILKEVSKEYLSDKLVEPMGKEEIEKIILEKLQETVASEFSHPHRKLESFLAEALVGKVGKQEEIVKIIKSSWLNTNARADLLKSEETRNKLEDINNSQCEQLADDLLLLSEALCNAMKGKEDILKRYHNCDNPNCGKGAICNYCALRKDIEAICGGEMKNAKIDEVVEEIYETSEQYFYDGDNIFTCEAYKKQIKQELASYRDGIIKEIEKYVNDISVYSIVADKKESEMKRCIKQKLTKIKGGK